MCLNLWWPNQYLFKNATNMQMSIFSARGNSVKWNQFWYHSATVTQAPEREAGEFLSPLTKRNIVTCYALRGDENCFCRVCYEVTS